ncbi:HAMP domain-containing sensor histidine kinase [Paraglaciecola sp.]|uniref:sensor histidine kinase n=1 Tax=Paraglaciecola sp. TaxID=1920173 RepID=UPI0030F3B3DB
MPNTTKFLSIKSLIIWVVMGITSLSLIVASSVNLFSQISSYQTELVNDVTTLAELIGNSAVNSIELDKSAELETALRVLAAAKIVENVHLYNILNDNKLDFFASYNKSGIAPVKTKFEQTAELSEILVMSGVAEIIRPIYNDTNDLVGYVYLRASAEALEDHINQSILLTLSVFLACIAICFFLTLKLQNAITAPIQTLVRLVQRIARQKDFSNRAEPNGIKELDILIDAFNGMLERTQGHMQRQANAENEYRTLNVSLEEKVNQRTLALKEANGELIQTLEKLHQFQRQMVQNEKMASLGDMVAGVAHEVNTPIGLGVTASTMMLDRLADMRKGFEDKTLKASALAKFITESEENLNIIYRNLNRAAELISSFKQVAVDQSSENNRIFSFAKLMDEILMSMRPKLKRVNHEIVIHCADDLYIESKAGPINQIMINLIMNSIIHGFEFIEKGIIDIDIVMQDDKKIGITFKDNGGGIPEQLRKRIFDPFVTTKRGQGGSGLGMHLVYNLVTQGLNGSISVQSETGKGVEFKIIFPVKRINPANLPKTALF